MICANCGSENTPGAKFCNECGGTLQAGCPTCGATNKPGARFCNECGTSLGAALGGSAAPPAASAQGLVQSISERRLVTVLFADIVGFTPFAEERDAEEVRDTLSRYFDLCTQVVERYGGTIEKFIGDAVMAVWGTPVAHEDDAERAVRAALELVDAVRALAPNAQARAGVLTGEAAVTIGATNQGMVAGDLVNTAARLQSVAPAGAVLVGEATFHAASDAVAFEPAGDQALKGKHAPVPAWRAMRVVAERGGRNRTETLEAPFVGRADELRLLKDLFHATGREKKVRLVSVMGPAGIGKSRLAWEFLKYVDGLVETTYWHSGRSPAYGEGISFWALGEMVRGRCGLVEGDDEQTTRRKVTETVEQWVADEAERAWITPALLALLGIESDMSSDQLFAAWRTFLERIALQGTVTLVFEDMHFADTGLLDFVEHLLDWSRGYPIYVVTLSRPELLERRQDWGAGKRNFSSIYLEPLPQESMRELLAGLAPGLPRAAVNAIVERADGVPLYAVETVRMLVADGRLVQSDGVYTPVGDLTSLAVPDTLTALIASRLDALDPVDRGLIHDAAVLGQSFSLGALAAVSGTSDDLQARVDGLIRRELLARAVDARSPERGQLSFVQALIREVAYNTLARRERKARHLAAARYFESLGSDELAGALAGHYLAAHRSAGEGPEADALAVQARIALSAAAERAAGLGAHDQAAAFLEQGLEVASEAEDRAQLLERAGDAARSAGRADNADAFYRRAAELYLEFGDRHGAARAAAGRATAYLADRRNTAALEVLERAWAEFGDLWPAEPAVKVKLLMGRAFAQTQQPRRALEILDEVLDAAEHADLLPIVATSLVGKGAALGATGRLHEAIALLEGAERLARENGLTEALASALVVGGFHLGEVDSRAAFLKFSEGLELSRRTGQRTMLLTFVNNIGYTGFLSGDWDKALDEMKAVLEEDVALSHRIWLLGNSISVLASRGDDVSAMLAELQSLTESTSETEQQVPLGDALGNAHLAGGDLLEAREAWLAITKIEPAQAVSSFYLAGRADLWRGDLDALREDLRGLEATGFHGRIVDARRVTMNAGIAAGEGRTVEAQAAYRAAVRAWRESGMVFEEALTGIDMVVALGAEQADQEIVRSSRAILERLGARPYLARLDAALGRSSTPDEAIGAKATPALVSEPA